MLIVDYTISESFQKELMITEGGTQKRDRQFKTNDKITQNIANLGVFDQSDNLILKLDYPIDFLITSISDVSKAIKIQEESHKFQEENLTKSAENNLREEWERTVEILREPLNLSFAPTLYIDQDWEKLSQELDNEMILSTRIYFAKVKDEHQDNAELKELVEKFNTENKKIANDSLKEEVEYRNSMLQEETKTSQEITDWIKKHGSIRLKLMLENGYELISTYEEERGQKELPECDYNVEDKKYRFVKKSNPSLKALELAEEYKQRGYHAEVISVEDKGEAISIQVPWAQYNFIELI